MRRFPGARFRGRNLDRNRPVKPPPTPKCGIWSTGSRIVQAQVPEHGQQQGARLVGRLASALPWGHQGVGGGVTIATVQNPTLRPAGADGSWTDQASVRLGSPQKIIDD